MRGPNAVETGDKVRGVRAHPKDDLVGRVDKGGDTDAVEGVREV